MLRLRRCQIVNSSTRHVPASHCQPKRIWPSRRAHVTGARGGVAGGFGGLGGGMGGGGEGGNGGVGGGGEGASKASDWIEGCTERTVTPNVAERDAAEMELAPSHGAEVTALALDVTHALTSAAASGVAGGSRIVASTTTLAALTERETHSG